MVMPPGAGKSRVILALMLLVNAKFPKIKVLYHHKSLLEEDRDRTKTIEKFVKADIELICVD